MSAPYQMMLADLLGRPEARGEVECARKPLRRRSRLLRDTRRQSDPESRDEQEDDPHLRALAARAQALVRLLQSGVPIRQRPEIVAAYAQAAAAAGIAVERVHDAIELLVHEHARLSVDDDRMRSSETCSRERTVASRQRRCDSWDTAGAAARRLVTAPLLREILQLADPGFATADCSHASASVADVVPHWCRSGSAMPSRPARSRRSATTIKNRAPESFIIMAAPC